MRGIVLAGYAAAVALMPTAVCGRSRKSARVPALALVLGLALTAAGCGNWPMFRHDPQHTAQSQYNTASVHGVLKWKFSFPKGCMMVSSPAVGSDGKVYIGAICGSGSSTSGGFCAVNSNGKSAWCSINLQGYPMYSSAAIGEAVYVGGFDSGKPGLLAIDPENGGLIWSFPKRVISSPPTLAVGLTPDGRSIETTIYIGSLNGVLYAVHPDGTEKWELALGSPDMSTPTVNGSPAVAPDGTIYVGLSSPSLVVVGKTPPGGLEAVNPDGTEKWLFDSGGVDSSPCVGGDGTIYFGSYDQFFYAVKPDGSAKWALANVGQVFSSPGFAPGGGVIYFGSRNHRVYAVDPKASAKWTFLTGGVVDSSPAISSDGTIFVGSSDHYLYAINPDGTLKWKYLTGGPVRSSPAIGLNGKAIYVGSDDGSLYAIQ